MKVHFLQNVMPFTAPASAPRRRLNPVEAHRLSRFCRLYHLDGDQRQQVRHLVEEARSFTDPVGRLERESAAANDEPAAAAAYMYQIMGCKPAPRPFWPLKTGIKVDWAALKPL